MFASQTVSIPQLTIAVQRRQNNASVAQQQHPVVSVLGLSVGLSPVMNKKVKKNLVSHPQHTFLFKQSFLDFPASLLDFLNPHRALGVLPGPFRTPCHSWSAQDYPSARAQICSSLAANLRTGGFDVLLFLLCEPGSSALCIYKWRHHLSPRALLGRAEAQKQHQAGYDMRSGLAAWLQPLSRAASNNVK